MIPHQQLCEYKSFWHKRSGGNERIRKSTVFLIRQEMKTPGTRKCETLRAPAHTRSL